MAIKVDVSLDDKDKENLNSYRIKVTDTKEELDQFIIDNIENQLLFELGVYKEFIATENNSSYSAFLLGSTLEVQKILVAKMDKKLDGMLKMIIKSKATSTKRLLNCKPYLHKKHKKILTKLIRKLIISLNNKYSLKPNIKEVIRFQH